MSWDDLRYIEALDRLGSAAAAARELGVAPSTVYRRIAALEQSRGIICLTRTPQGATLTPVGKEVARIARVTREALSEVDRLRHRETKEVTGTVSLTTVESLVPLLDQSLVRMATHHPRLRISLNVANTGPSVRKNEVDIALSVVPKPPPALVGRRLFATGYAVYATASVAGLPPAQLRWVIIDPPTRSGPAAAWEREHVPENKVALSCNSRLTFLSLVRSGAGVGVLPRRLAVLYPDLVELDLHRDSLDPLESTVWILTHPSRRRSANVAAVVAELVSTLGDQGRERK